MELVQILLPLFDNRGSRIPQALFRNTASELAERYGGVTAYVRSPAHGLWRRGAKIDHDAIVVYEVMLRAVDRKAWARQRRRYERDFRQKTIVIRSMRFRSL